MDEQIIKENPWLKITDGLVRIAECDRPWFDKEESAEAYAERINDKYKDVELTFNCLPEPFNGNPDSKVYCLNKNPGKPDARFVGVKEFTDAMIRNLQLKSKNSFWTESIPKANGQEHAGVDWFRKRTRKLRELLGRHPDIFFIEYFPYHSSKGFNFPEGLPSYEFSNKLGLICKWEDKILVSCCLLVPLCHLTHNYAKNAFIVAASLR